MLHYPDESVPPGGAIFYTGNLIPQFRGDFFFATLRSEHLQRVHFRGGEMETIERWFSRGGEAGRYGRLRNVVQGPDGAIYVTTSNRDRRGEPQAADDRVLRIAPTGR